MDKKDDIALSYKRKKSNQCSASWFYSVLFLLWWYLSSCHPKTLVISCTSMFFSLLPYICRQKLALIWIMCVYLQTVLCASADWIISRTRVRHFTSSALKLVYCFWFTVVCKSASWCGNTYFFFHSLPFFLAIWKQHKHSPLNRKATKGRANVIKGFRYESRRAAAVSHKSKD